MKCLSCGEIAADSAKFCENCGTKLTHETTGVDPVTEIPETKVGALPNEEPISTLIDSPSETVTVEAQSIPNPVVVAGRSGIFAAANVMFTINTVMTALMSVLALFLGGVGAVIMFAEYLGADYYIDYLNALPDFAVEIAVTIGIIWLILANVPLILINIGLCQTRSACMNPDGENIRPTGLKLIRVIAVLGIILTALVLAVMLIASIFFMIGDVYIKAIGISLLSLTLTAVIVFTFCSAKLMTTLNSVINTARGLSPKKASAFLGVLCIIVSVFYLYNIFACLALIFYAVTLFKYNAVVGSRNG